MPLQPGQAAFHKQVHHHRFGPFHAALGSACTVQKPGGFLSTAPLSELHHANEVAYFVSLLFISAAERLKAFHQLCRKFLVGHIERLNFLNNFLEFSVDLEKRKLVW
ncbi:hypothetical protein GRAN_5141 [Granulicella sibirica]|uniref:Uncharacterized protein n=1 Tax=Granulicella sibirica TaxID=2479048 RepID=A0A4Q0SSC5_9BACT|nr:hypothetical protein GRAN_5141 [Granulicella sibirica]